MCLRARQLAYHEVGFADVLVRAAMARIELDGALVVFEREVVLLQVAVGIAKHVLQVRLVGMAHLRALEKARGVGPVLLLDRPLARGVVLVAGSEIGIRLVGVGGGDRGERRDRRAQKAHAGEAGEAPHSAANFFALTSSGRAVSASFASASSLR